MSLSSDLGSPPPPKQPPGHVITSIMRNFFFQSSFESKSIAEPIELTAATEPRPSIVATLIPRSTPRTPSYSIGASTRPSASAAVRRAASNTPPLAPKIAPAPLASPMGESYWPSLLREAKGILRCLIIFASSLVVSTASISPLFPGLTASSFLAVQGMMDTTKGSSPPAAAIFFAIGPDLDRVPCIC